MNNNGIYWSVNIFSRNKHSFCASRERVKTWNWIDYEKLRKNYSLIITMSIALHIIIIVITVIQVKLLRIKVIYTIMTKK